MLDVPVLIHRMRGICTEFDMDVRDWWDLVRALLEGGLPPSPHDEADFRSWLRGLASSLNEFVEHTDTTIDDNFVMFLYQICESDTAWSLFYRLFIALYAKYSPWTMTYDVTDEEIGLSSELSSVLAMRIDWSDITAIINAIIAFLQLFSERRVENQK